MRLCCLMGLVLLSACSCRNPLSEREVEPAEEQVPLQKTGGCENESLEGECTYLGMHTVTPDRDNAPEGTALYQVSHIIKAGEREVEIDKTYLRIPVEREEDLRTFFEENSPVACQAYVVWPPCNPQATSLELELDLPEYVSKERY